MNSRMIWPDWQLEPKEEPQHYICEKCGMNLNASSRIFVKDGKYLGCEYCVETYYCDDYSEE